MSKDIVLIGPPGTGKTEAGLTVSRGWFKSGKASASEVAYLAFTRAAAKEAASRIFDEDVKGDVGDRLPFFRTLHSLSYRGLREERPDVRLVTTADMKLFGKWSSYEGLYAIEQWEDLSEAYSHLEKGGRTEWDDCLRAYTLSRIGSKTPKDLEAARFKTSKLANKMVGVEEEVYKVFVQKYEAYKRANGLVDFTDMLAYALTEMKPLDNVKYVVIDECQDLAQSLHGIISRLFSNAEEVWWCGDDDQCIFSFSAADPSLFLDKARNAYARIFLRQTHRFGQDVVDLSRKIIHRVRDRVEKEVIGLAGKNHTVQTTGSFQPTAGRMLLLHRHVMGCQALAQAYIAAGLPFRNERGKDPLGSSMRIKAFQAMRDLADGKEVSMGSVARLVDDLMPSTLVSEAEGRTRLVVHGAKKKLQETTKQGPARLPDLVRAGILTAEGADLVRMKQYRAFKYADDLEYYDRVIQNGHDLEGDAPIITTMHGSKGRQADRVVVFTEMGRKCWDDPDTEHRLAYVAATRTRGDLEFCAERTVDWAENSYDYPLTPQNKEI